eukprot:CAMPEP_0185595838 /NCGR_PEP_ID=MMETSP0434-20130131/79676_1 /TAXON_ID=626734 ORGANISM="Favella taraikaensis, Strain Fe Narragansett Bay" /NCGR_SAMPLE_ID=MMETSP0434 /ASSEMBLY_ACC=CAM_ASM_000379 /LENGTH=69 /DNA_ID=CAMNT_0028224099 /DNA_START=291 /DNA_END=500 /DNA_ORIENTATION=+
MVCLKKLQIKDMITEVSDGLTSLAIDVGKKAEAKAATKQLLERSLRNAQEQENEHKFADIDKRTRQQKD